MLLVAGRAGHLFLAEQTKQGVQLDVENFSSWDEAETWSAKMRVGPPVVIEGLELSFRECSILHLLGTETRTIADAHAAYSQRHRQLYLEQRGETLSERDLPGQVAIRNAVTRLSKVFLVHVHRPQPAFPSWLVSRTTIGTALVNQLGFPQRRAA